MASESFSSKLRRLRREGPQAPERPEGIPVWLRQKLGSQAPGRATRDAQIGAAPGAAPGPYPSLCPTTVGEPEYLRVHDGAHGAFTARETDFGRDHLHGTWRLDEHASADARAFELLSGDGALAGLDLERAVFLDTETTGLSGGAGVFVYMVGLGWFEGESFRLWQGFLRGPDEELALLAEVSRIVGDKDAVVSFFGKSFDRHRLEDKMRIVGVEPTFEGRPHLDLYHPFRRLTQGHLVDGRLATVEAALVGLERDDDLPGAFAPAAWFDFLAGRAHRLEGVFRHNRDDVLSLVTLAAYLGRTLHERRASGDPLVGCSHRRASAIARAHLAAGDRETAVGWLDRALERARAAGEGTRELALLRAETLRLAKRTEDARQALEAFVAEDQPVDDHTVPALVSLAKLLEHGCRDAPAAIRACERARALGPGGREERALHKRLERLGRKT
ncbi:MAG: ribonuclease H-like domain-containing protein [bacterium]|nr:ribonuclease H-like domain-containing protein [bacterium]